MFPYVVKTTSARKSGYDPPALIVYSIFDKSSSPPSNHFNTLPAIPFHTLGGQLLGTGMETLKWEYDVVATEVFRRLQSVGEDHEDSYSRLQRLHASDPVLEQFWRATRTVPAWVDWDQLRRGQTVCKRYAVPMLIGFAFQGFAGEIAAALGPAEVLVRTGGLSQRNVLARVEATLRWLLEVTQSAESLQADGSGFVSTIRVRLRHAAVRHRMLSVPRSHPAFLDTALHGVPINTYDSVLTLTFFCCNPIWKQLPRLGIHLSAQEAEDLIALFRFLAHLLGVPTEYFSSAAQAKKTMEDIKTARVTPSESSRKITRDFICAFADRAPYNVSCGFLHAGIRAMNPAYVSDALGVGPVGWTPYIAFLGLRWSIKLAILAQDTGFPLPSASDMIQVREVLERGDCKESLLCGS